MIRAQLSYVAEACGGERVGRDVPFAGVTTDSRQVSTGRLFIPLSGPSYNGHDYCESAMESGAAAFIWPSDVLLPDSLRDHPHVRVADPLLALQALATAYRSSLSVRVVAVTGSNGKTSTKDLTAAVLSTCYQTYKTPGNLNSHIGLPLCVLEWDDRTEVAVLEMGMRGLGEIAQLCAIARPEIGIITLIGEAHLERLGSREQIAAAKWELIAALPYGGLAVLPDDEPLLAQHAVPVGVRVRRFGETAQAQCRLLTYQQTATGSVAQVTGLDEPLQLATVGRHQARNALIALTIAEEFGISLAEAAQALMSADKTAQRTAVQSYPGLTVIDDSYNAAPTSVRAGLAVLAETEADARLAVLGDMLELGATGPELHAAIGAELKRFGVDSLITVGELAASFAQGALTVGAVEVIASVETAQAAIEPALAWLAQHREKRRAVLCKGSNRLGLGVVASALSQVYDKASE